MRTITAEIYFFLILTGTLCIFISCAEKQPDTRMYKGLPIAYSMVLSDSSLWVEEIHMNEGSEITYSSNNMDINTSKGATIWFNKKLSGEVIIRYQITILDQNGPNDRVSDMNCFWMFSDPKTEDGNLRFGENERNGEFRNYHELQGYYVGLGGHNNTKTRFRRYDGNADRQLLPEHDLSSPEFLITPNQTYTVTLVARGNQVQYYRDEDLIFDVQDTIPYTEGWFGFRTVTNHMKIKNFEVYMK